MNEKIKINKEGTLLQIKVIANASKNELEELDEFFKLRIKAPAVDNKANQEIVKFLSDYFNVKKNNVEIIHGSKSSRKTVLIKEFNYFEDQNG